jgi:arginase
LNSLNISVIGVPSDFGQSRRGVDMGPSALRYAGAMERLESLGHHVTDLGDLHIHKKFQQQTHPTLKNVEGVVDVSTRLAAEVSRIVEKQHFPLVLGGDHSIAIGTLAGLAAHYENLGVIWYDAHADMNTEQTSPSGNIHGMPLAVSMGYGAKVLTDIRQHAPAIKPENVVLIGARSIDPGEKQFIREHGIQVYTMHDVDRLGMTRVMQEAIIHLEGQHVDGVHLSLDLDAIDPLYTPGVGTPVAGGLSYRESHLAMEMLQDSNLITSLEIVEVNPILDERNRTAEVAVTLLGSLMGEQLV